MIFQIRRVKSEEGDHSVYRMVALAGTDPESPVVEEMCTCDNHSSPVTAWRCRTAKRAVKKRRER